MEKTFNPGRRRFMQRGLAAILGATLPLSQSGCSVFNLMFPPKAPIYQNGADSDNNGTTDLMPEYHQGRMVAFSRMPFDQLQLQIREFVFPAELHSSNSQYNIGFVTAGFIQPGTIDAVRAFYEKNKLPILSQFVSIPLSRSIDKLNPIKGEISEEAIFYSESRPGIIEHGVFLFKDVQENGRTIRRFYSLDNLDNPFFQEDATQQRKIMDEAMKHPKYKRTGIDLGSL